MSKKHIIRIDGKTVEVSDEIYTFLKRSEWNSNYAELRRKRERIIIDCEAMTVKTIPGKEDSLERLESVGIEIPDKTEPFENVLINKAESAGSAEITIPPPINAPPSRLTKGRYTEHLS